MIETIVISLIVIAILAGLVRVGFFLFTIVAAFWRNPGIDRHEEASQQPTNDRIPIEVGESSNVTGELGSKWYKDMDKEQLRLAVRENLEILDTIDESVWSDKEMVLAAVKGCGGALNYLPDELRTDEEVLLTALNSDQLYWDYWNDFESFMVAHFSAQEVRSDPIVSRLEEITLAFFKDDYSEQVYDSTNYPEMYDSDGNFVGRDLRHLSDLDEAELEDIPYFLVEDCMKRKQITEK